MTADGDDDGFVSLAFSTSKILSGELHDVDKEVEYTVGTVKRGSTRLTTALREPGAGKEPTALIDWRARLFEISGHRKRVVEMKSTKGAFSSSRYWSWFDEEEYRVKYSAEMAHTWTLYSYTGDVLATLTSAVHRLLAQNSLPVLRIASTVTDEDERRFIVLVLLYSETKRLESVKERPISVVADLLEILPFPSASR
ncbi:hypothetical protein MKEN_00484300 [Mycena kentingensis (nom. inval.)]|nr:hypothetical protein MKEN_00484300 [Mycena kentingensis (nom. inval.)]